MLNCPKCRREFGSDDALHRHCRDKADHPYCMVCRRVFDSKEHEKEVVIHTLNISRLNKQHTCPGDFETQSDSSETPRTRIDEFFAQYPSFDYDPTEEIMSQFYRLCDSFDWDRDDSDRQQAREEIRDALVATFNDMYGTDVDDIGSWRKLCQVLRISPSPEELDECREAVKRVHVNLVDLVDVGKTGRPVVIYPTELALSKYTKETGKYFPRDSAHAGGVLAFLLRHIEFPREEPGERGGGRGRRGGGGARRGRRQYF